MLDLSKYKSSNPTMKPNRMLIPVNGFAFNDEGMVEFNKIYQYCLEHANKGDMKHFIITRSGGISTAIGNIRGAMWQLVVKKTFVEIVMRDFDARYYRFQIGHSKDKKEGLHGHQAFIIYKEMLIKHGISLESLAINNGKEIKETIPAPRIELTVPEDRTYYNVHHIDLNSAYNAGMMKAFPVLEPAIRELYNKREQNESYKDVLNMTQGFMQSEMVGYKYAHISKAGYVYTLDRLEDLTNKLIAKGYRILAYNTDGIWYQSFDGSKYSDEDEGKDIGQWKHDYIDCQIRFRSKGCYEFIGTKTKNNTIKYKPVFRGESSYEKIKPKEEWTWGDIYKGDVVEYIWKDGIGVTKKNVNNK